ncbi:ThiF family adenylyltransferase [Pseudoalteromonas sp. CnMc7-15]|uniref:ThiF family adenylyltransferase n=1 Tax=unclassified Pseudoalteromonas TaxID=194690 RepID=UPI001EF490DD|nr:ThiF family adenylyltransferase [Pseudoalteromonas sp. CnMc7-15]MCG7566605.1 ThiF family adenylyltransferase [Pseudoalteromonas sp. CnMc7-15]
MNVELKISSPTLAELNNHLFPGDGKEAVAFILCGSHVTSKRTILLAHKVIPIPFEDCVLREKDRVVWKTTALQHILNEAENNNWAVIKVHSHPEGYDEFSKFDDTSDAELFPSIYNWLGNGLPNLSAILLPKNKVIARVVDENGQFEFVSKISLISNELSISYKDGEDLKIAEDFELRNIQVFGRQTRDTLKRLKVAVIGTSGTGSPIIEQLSRLGVGELVLVDPDVVEEKNLNRITNAKREDADKKSYKVDVLKKAVVEMGLGTFVTAHALSIFDPNVVTSIASCDFIFGCVDSAEARCLLNRVCNYYLIPMIDIGISLVADGEGGVTNICGKVGYFQPGLSDHLSRRSVLPQTLESEALRRISPNEYRKKLSEGYIKGVPENSPAIIPVNTYTSSFAVLEFLARVHVYRHDSNEKFAEQQFCLVNDFRLAKAENLFSEGAGAKTILGLGDKPLILDMPEFSVSKEVA